MVFFQAGKHFQISLRLVSLSFVLSSVYVVFFFKLLLIPEIVGSTLKISLDLFPSMNH